MIIELPSGRRHRIPDPSSATVDALAAGQEVWLVAVDGAQTAAINSRAVTMILAEPGEDLSALGLPAAAAPPA